MHSANSATWRWFCRFRSLWPCLRAVLRLDAPTVTRAPSAQFTTQWGARRGVSTVRETRRSCTCWAQEPGGRLAQAEGQSEAPPRPIEAIYRRRANQIEERPSGASHAPLFSRAKRPAKAAKWPNPAEFAQSRLFVPESAKFTYGSSKFWRAKSSIN